MMSIYKSNCRITSVKKSLSTLQLFLASLATVAVGLSNRAEAVQISFGTLNNGNFVSAITIVEDGMNDIDGTVANNQLKFDLTNILNGEFDVKGTVNIGTPGGAVATSRLTLTNFVATRAANNPAGVASNQNLAIQFSHDFNFVNVAAQFQTNSRLSGNFDTGGAARPLGTNGAAFAGVVNGTHVGPVINAVANPQNMTSPFNLNNGLNNVGVLPGLNNIRGDLVINLSSVDNRISLPNSADVLIGEDIPAVPEPLTILGSLSTLGIGVMFKRKKDLLRFSC
jgi:hypothetical protein